MAATQQFGRYEVCVVLPDEFIGCDRLEPNALDEPMVEVFRADFSGSKRQRFVNRLTWSNLMAETARGRMRVKRGTPTVAGEVSREVEIDREKLSSMLDETVVDPGEPFPHPKHVLVTHERPRDIANLHLHPPDLDWKAVRAWLATLDLG